MTVTARTYAYLAALLMAFGSVAPWMEVGGEPGGASPLGLGTMLALAAAALAATVRRHRPFLGVLAIATALIAVYTLWDGIGSPLVRMTHETEGPMVTSIGGGLSVIVLGAMLLYIASWLPAPRSRTADDGRTSSADGD